MEEEEEVDAEIFEPFELCFSDLVMLSSSRAKVSSSSGQERQRLESIAATLMENLGPSGPGLLLVNGVPKASNLRRTLLPLARKLALLSNEHRRRILKEHSLGSDVPLKNPDRNVSSFALQLKYVQDPSSGITFGESINDVKDDSEMYNNLGAESLQEIKDDEFENLEKTFRELGFCMMEVGLLLAQVCDRVIGGQELEQSILGSCTAKGRLIHYHSTQDNLILKEASKAKSSSNRLRNHQSSLLHAPRVSDINDQYKETTVEDVNLATSQNVGRSCRTSLSNLWQQWHYDYGIFTVLTGPMFISTCSQQTTEAKEGLWIPCEQECLSPDGHSYLQIFDPNKKSIRLVRCPPESLVVQVGESADILSKGKLRSTLHSVCRPVNREYLSRETFVVFLQPAWDKTLCVSDVPSENLMQFGICSSKRNEEIQSTAEDIACSPSGQQSHKLTEMIHKIIPPLSSRFKDGMTFAEFSLETTRQYYGGSGVQSKRQKFQLCLLNHGHKVSEELLLIRSQLLVHFFQQIQWHIHFDNES